MSTEQKRKELEAANYIVTNVNQVITPDGAEYFTTDDEPSAINKAYEHLQRDTKLKALDEFMHEYETMPSNLTDDYFNAWVARYAVIMAVKCNNITADEGEGNE